MDVRYINPFIEAVQHVFRRMLESDARFSAPFIKQKNAVPPEISAIIEFSGGATGSVALCFSRQIAIKVASKFAGDEISVFQTALLADALGELTNMVAGQSKAKLPAEDISISLPRVVMGDQHRVLESATLPVLMLPCDSTLGRFHVEVTMVTRQFSPFAVEGHLDSAPSPS